MMASTVSLGIPYAVRISIIFPRCIESKALGKSINRRTAGRFLVFIPSRIRPIVRICPGVDLCVRKPFFS